MNAPLINRDSFRAPPRPMLPFMGELALPLGRVSELAGPARRTLAAIIAARLEGPVFWILPSWQAERLNPEGLCRLMAPGRLTFVEPQRAEDLLWCMEEVLRAGAVPLVVADLGAPPALTPVRRLQLAAEAGFSASGHWPLGLILTPDQGGAPAVESRWHMAPQHKSGKAAAWRLARLRARSAPPAQWQVTVEKGRFCAQAHSQEGAPVLG